MPQNLAYPFSTLPVSCYYALVRVESMRATVSASMLSNFPRRSFLKLPRAQRGDGNWTNRAFLMRFAVRQETNSSSTHEIASYKAVGPPLQSQRTALTRQKCRKSSRSKDLVGEIHRVPAGTSEESIDQRFTTRAEAGAETGKNRSEFIQIVCRQFVIRSNRKRPVRPFQRSWQRAERRDHQSQAYATLQGLRIRHHAIN
jgi:hypothetical protein